MSERTPDESVTPNEALTIKRLERELAEARDNGNNICGYCGLALHKPNAWEDLRQHIETCEKHPLATARAEVETAARRFWEAGSAAMASEIDNDDRDTTFDAAWSRYQQERAT